MPHTAPTISARLKICEANDSKHGWFSEAHCPTSVDSGTILTYCLPNQLTFEIAAALDDFVQIVDGDSDLVHHRDRRSVVPLHGGLADDLESAHDSEPIADRRTARELEQPAAISS